MALPSLVWYASYGSNLDAERFGIYIKGGKTPGSNQFQPGCDDKSDPVAVMPLVLNKSLYFGGWIPNIYDGGTAGAFIKSEESGRTYSRAYLITLEQYIDVVRQENAHKDAKTPNLTIDVETAINVGYSQLLDEGYYDQLIFCGYEGDYPILSFTHSSQLEYENPPSISYLKMIASGLHQAHGLSRLEIAEYFVNKEGVKETYDKGKLLREL